MTAREELLAQFEFEGWEDGPVVLGRYRAEVLREAAEEIRRWAADETPDLFDEERCGALSAADHIDPDVDDRRSDAP